MDKRIETGKNGPEELTATFEKFEETVEGMSAVFKDPETGHNFFLSREELLDKIENLKKEGLSSNEEEKALKNWPKSIDKIIIQ